MPYSTKPDDKKQLHGVDTVQRLDTRIDRYSQRCLLAMLLMFKSTGHNYSLSVIMRLAIRDLFRNWKSDRVALQNNESLDPENMEAIRISLQDDLLDRCKMAAAGEFDVNVEAGK